MHIPGSPRRFPDKLVETLFLVLQIIVGHPHGNLKLLAIKTGKLFYPFFYVF